ncbi:MAG: hemerythrin domain-containing protein [Planctomycetes bacterium]|nr:hemerythrin domain-containing protein [Planctomycetota bacterium]
MNQPQTNHELFEDIRREHEELRELLGEIHRTLANRLAAVASVSAMLVSLGDHIKTHFEEEETTGLFDNIVDRAPRLSERIDALRTEHQQLLAVVRQLNEVARNGDGSVDWWQRLNTDFHKFSAELMHHETAENDILLEAYTDDIGASD